MTTMGEGVPDGRTPVGRRTIAKGFAWSAPVIAATAAAPVASASGLPIVFSHITTWRWYNNSMPGCAEFRDGLKINTIEGGSGVKFSNTTTSTLITNVYADFWFTRNDIVWSADTGNSVCWSTPTLQNGTYVNGGRTYYSYRSSYSTVSCPITAVAGTTVLSAYSWKSQCFNESDANFLGAKWVRRTAYATINGVARPQDNPQDSGTFQINN